MIGALNRFVSKVELFTLYFSCDGLGERGKYIRDGLDIDLFKANLEEVLSTIQWPIRVSFMCTVSALNGPEIPELIEYIDRLRAAFPRHFFALDTPYVRFPRFMDIRILPQQLRESWLKDSIEAINKSSFDEVEKNRLARLLDHVGADLEPRVLEQARGDFEKMFTEYDKRRGKSFQKVFPELISFMQSCKS